MKTNLLDIIDGFRNKPFMVIGDMVADVYIDGRIARISREAPVLILEHAGEQVRPGGAANVVNNAVTMGADVYAVGLLGSDAAGDSLRQELLAKGVHTEGLVDSGARPTITKTRIMAGGQATVRQQIVRIDRQAQEAVDKVLVDRMLAYVQSHIDAMSSVVLSDYGSGTVAAPVRDFVIRRCREKNIACIVDSRYAVLDYKGIKIVKQNESEAAAALGMKLQDEAAVHAAGEELLRRLAAEAVLISRGPDGMALFEAGGRITDIPVTNKSEVYDVTGAGDTVVVSMMLARAAGASYEAAARISNFAAGVVVRKPGTATAAPEEVKKAIGDYDGNVI